MHLLIIRFIFFIKYSLFTLGFWFSLSIEQSFIHIAIITVLSFSFQYSLLEHQSKKSLSGKEVDRLVDDANRYLVRIKKLFKQIDKIKEEDSLVHTYDTTITILRDILRFEGIDTIKEENILKTVEKEMFDSGKMAHKFLKDIKLVIKAKKDYDAKKLTKTDISNVKKVSRDLHKYLVEHIQRQRGREIQKAKIRVKYGNKFGEVLLLGKTAFIIHDLDSDEKAISKADVDNNGSLQKIRESNNEELEHALVNDAIPSRVFIKEPIFENLKEIFGKDVEVMLHH